MAILDSHNATEIIKQSHPIWNSSFGPAERQHMLHEDSTAFRSVSLELVSIVSLGFLLMAVTIAAILLVS